MEVDTPVFYCTFFSSFLSSRFYSYPLNVPEITAFFLCFFRREKREKTKGEAGGILVVAFGHTRSSRKLSISSNQIVI